LSFDGVTGFNAGMRWRCLLVLLTIASCTHAPWNPHRGWSALRTNNVEMYTDALVQEELTLQWLDSSFEVLGRTFFSSTSVPPVKVIYLSTETASPFTSASGGALGFTANTRPPSKKGPMTVLVVGKSGEMQGYAHVMAHYFIEAAVPGAPIWLQAGLASYASIFRNDSRDPSRICFGFLQPARMQSVMEPMATLFSVSWSDYNDTLAPNINDTAFGLVDYLLNGEGGRLRGRFDALLTRLGSGMKSADAISTVFPEFPLETLDERVRGHVRARRPEKECPHAVPLVPRTVDKIAPIKRAVSEEEMRRLFEDLQAVPVRRGHADFPPPA
jgi:hypothetical protein